jgi:alpha-1,2-mannosyltransferase
MLTSPADRVVPPWVRRGGPIVLGVALLGYLGAYLHWPNLLVQVDAQVYRFGGLRVTQGLDLYSIGLTGNPKTLLFDYTPFSALTFVPLSWFSTLSTQILVLAINLALLTALVFRLLARCGVTRAQGLGGLGALIVGLLLWFEPVRLTIELGQVNLLIAAIVVLDIAAERTRFSGVGVGLVAGIKLTPAIFIVWLVMIGRVRAAVVATLTVIATILVGFAVLPADSRFFWLQKGFDDVHRISSDPVSNTSLRGLAERLGYSGVAVTAAVVLVAILGLLLAALAWRRGEAVLGIAIAGMTSAAVSPFSWTHHWVWVAVLLVALAYYAAVRRQRWAAVAMVTTWLLLGGWFVTYGPSPEAGITAFRHPGTLDTWLPACYLGVYLLVLIATTGWLVRRRATPVPAEEATAEPVSASA